MKIKTEIEWIAHENRELAKAWRQLRNMLQNPNASGVKTVKHVQDVIHELERQVHKKLGDVPPQTSAAPTLTDLINSTLGF